MAAFLQPSALSRSSSSPGLRIQPASKEAALESARPGTSSAINRLPLSPAVRTQQAQALRRRLATQIDGVIDVAITDNRSVMLSVKRDPRHRRYALRAHHIFVNAPDDVVQALGRYLAFNDSTASRELNHFIDQNEYRIEPAERERAAPLRAAGKVYDLIEVFERLNQRYFNGALRASITWGRHVQRDQLRSSIRLGSYTVEENLIRIHPGLDQHWVPPYYLEWVLFHEMLHLVHPVSVVKGRRCFHTPEFNADERQFEHYDVARAWERRNIASLLRI